MSSTVILKSNCSCDIELKLLVSGTTLLVLSKKRHNFAQYSHFLVLTDGLLWWFQLKVFEGNTAEMVIYFYNSISNFSFFYVLFIFKLVKSYLVMEYKNNGTGSH